MHQIVNILRKLLTLAKKHINHRFISGILITVASLILLLWRLVSLTNGRISSNEAITKHLLFVDSSWNKILSNIYGPYYLLLHISFTINHSIWAFRIASVVTGLLCAIALYWMISLWHGYKIATLALLMLLTNLGFLALARQASPIISQLLMLTTLVIATVLLRTKKNIKAIIFLVCAVGFSLYVPGGIWFAITALILTITQIREIVASKPIINKMLLPMITIVLALPILFHLVTNYSSTLIKNWLGYGLGSHGQLNSFFSNFIHTPLNLFIYSDLSPSFGIKHIPLIPISFSLIILIGTIYYIRRIKNWHWRNILIFILLSWIISGFGVISSIVSLPLLDIAFATGLAYMLKEWYQVFPRNHLVRFIGLALITTVVLLTSFYSGRSYFVAWAYNPNVTSMFSRKL